MTCEAIQSGQITEKYVQGLLSAEDKAAFEEHYATCTGCFERMRALEMSPGSPGRPIRKKRRKKHRARKYGWVWVMAAVLAAAVGLAMVLQEYRSAPLESNSYPPVAPASPAASTPKPAPDPAVIAQLAQVQPPLYIESKRRVAETPAVKAFKAAMEIYARQDYRKAAEALRAAAELDRNAAAPRFYLAICELALQQNDVAMEDLRSVIALDDPTYLEEAHFFLAKALLSTQDLRGAREELFRAIRLAGERLLEARKILDRVEKMLPKN